MRDIILRLRISHLIKNYKADLEYLEKQLDNYKQIFEQENHKDEFYAGKLCAKLELLRKAINDLEHLQFTK